MKCTWTGARAANRGVPVSAPVTAQTLDGQATLNEIKAELAARVAVLKERGVVPGLGTVLVGDDPGSHWYVGAKHRDCAAIGIASIRRDLPAGVHAGRGRGRHRRAQRRPRVHRVHRPAAHRARRVRAALARRPRQGRRRAAPGQPRQARARRGRAAPVHARRARSSCCAATASRSTAPRSSWSVAASPSGGPLGLLLTRRSENATVTLCHTGTRDLAEHVREADIVIAAAGVPSIITADMVKPGAAVLDVGVSRVDGEHRRRRRPRRVGGGRLGLPEPQGRRADDPRHAAVQHRRHRGAAGSLTAR